VRGSERVGGRGARGEPRIPAGVASAPAPSAWPRPSTESGAEGRKGVGGGARPEPPWGGALPRAEAESGQQEMGPGDRFPSPHLHGAKSAGCVLPGQRPEALREILLLPSLSAALTGAASARLLSLPWQGHIGVRLGIGGLQSTRGPVAFVVTVKS